MEDFMKEITCEEMNGILSNGFLGKKMEIGLSNPIWSVNTYRHFDFTYDSENDKDDVLVLFDRDNEFPHQLRINKGQIDKILYLEGETIFNSTFSIFIGTDRIDICIDESPKYCCMCKKNISLDPYTSIWRITGVGNYGDKFFDSDKLNIPLCSDCLFYKVFGYTDEMLLN